MKFAGVLVGNNVVDLETSGGRISSITVVERVISDERALEFLWLFPGVIDDHIHSRVPDLFPDGSNKPDILKKEDLQHLSQAALAGGVTTMVVMPNTSPPISSMKVLQYARSLVPKTCRHSLRYWFGATKDNFGEIEAASREPDVVGVKEFDGSSTGDLLVEVEEDQLAVSRCCARLGLLKAVHAENEALLKTILANLGRQPLISEHSDVRNEEVEVSAIKRALRVNRQAKGRLHVCHVSTVVGAELIFRARAEGDLVSAEVAPHHWALNRDSLLLSDPGRYKMNPPLRFESTRQRIRQLVMSGAFDTIGSDHAPHLAEEKDRLNYKDVPSGVPEVQTLLPLALDLVLRDGMSRENLVRYTSAGPAKLLGLRDLGVIKVGAIADLAIIDPRQQTHITNRTMKSKCGWTPYDGMITKGRVVATILRGELLYDIR